MEVHLRPYVILSAAKDLLRRTPRHPERSEGSHVWSAFNRILRFARMTREYGRQVLKIQRKKVL